MANPDSGLWRRPAPSLDDGRCCHDRVPLRARPVVDDGGRDASSAVEGDGKA